jgi:hypothetical protein
MWVEYCIKVVYKLLSNVHILDTWFIQVLDVFALTQVIEFNDINTVGLPSSRWGTLGFVYIFIH